MLNIGLLENVGHVSLGDIFTKFERPHTYTLFEAFPGRQPIDFPKFIYT